MDEKKLDVIINADCSLFLMFVAEHSIFDVALVNDILNLGKQKALEIRNPDTLQEKIKSNENRFVGITTGHSQRRQSRVVARRYNCRSSIKNNLTCSDVNIIFHEQYFKGIE